MDFSSTEIATPLTSMESYTNAHANTFRLQAFLNDTMLQSRTSTAISLVERNVRYFNDSNYNCMDYFQILLRSLTTLVFVMVVLMACAMLTCRCNSFNKIHFLQKMCQKLLLTIK